MIVCTNLYFTSRRALASSICMTGTSVGAIVLAPLINYLLERYGWKVIMFILAGMNSLIIPLSLLLRPLKPPVNARSQRASQERGEERRFSLRTAEHVIAQPGYDNQQQQQLPLPMTSSVEDDVIPYSSKPNQQRWSADSSGPNQHNQDMQHCMAANTGINRKRSSSETSGSYIKNFFSKIFKWEIFTKTSFMVYVVAQFISEFACLIPVIYLPTLMLRNEIDSTTASLVMSAMAIGNTTGRLTSGLLYKFARFSQPIRAGFQVRRHSFRENSL